MSEKSLCVINFAREEDGVLTNGTLTTLDGPPRASWTFHQDGGQFTQTVEVDDEDFDDIWNAFERVPVFKRYVVRDPSTELDFRTVPMSQRKSSLHRGRRATSGRSDG